MLPSTPNELGMSIAKQNLLPLVQVFSVQNEDNTTVEIVMKIQIILLSDNAKVIFILHFAM